MRQQALEGIKIIELSSAIAGPFPSRMLADHGATVIRVESILKPDVFRVITMYKDNKPGINRCLSWSTYNCNKLDISLNLKHPSALDVVRKLVAWADIMIENFAPGTMEDLGLAYEDITKIRPDIVMMRVSNMGQTGPYARQPAYGPEVGAMCGFTNMTGWPDRLPVNPWGGAYADIIAGRLVAATVMAALDHRRRTGEGQELDLSMVEAGIGFLAPQMLDYQVNGRDLARKGNTDDRAAPHGAYPCQGEDQWCTIAVFTDEQWKYLCKVMGSPSWSGDSKFGTLSGRKTNEDELNGHIAEWTNSFNAEDLMHLLQKAGVPAGVVRDVPGICQDPQLEHRQHYWKVDHAEIGSHHCDSMSFNLSETPAQPRRGGPTLGQDNEYVCKEILGMTEEEYVQLLLHDVFK